MCKPIWASQSSSQWSKTTSFIIKNPIYSKLFSYKSLLAIIPSYRARRVMEGGLKREYVHAPLHSVGGMAVPQ